MTVPAAGEPNAALNGRLSESRNFKKCDALSRPVRTTHHDKTLSAGGEERVVHEVRRVRWGREAIAGYVICKTSFFF
jgi:hypothetical protein